MFIEKLNVKVLLLNNQHLGMVVQWEDRFYKVRGRRRAGGAGGTRGGRRGRERGRTLGTPGRGARGGSRRRGVGTGAVRWSWGRVLALHGPRAFPPPTPLPPLAWHSLPSPPLAPADHAGPALA